MKNILKLLIIITLFYNCDSNDIGNIIQKEISVADFNEILINENIELILKEGQIQEVIVEAGDNIINDIDIKVVENELIVTNNNTKNYNTAKVYITSPNITKIRNSSELAVYSEGILTYPSLFIISENYLSNFLNSGDFYLTVDTTDLYIVSNGVSNYYIDGQTTDLRVYFYGGDSRFEGKNLIATNVDVLHKTSNVIKVNPQAKIIGDIYSLGNVIAYNEPVTVDVTEHFQGRLIFE